MHVQAFVIALAVGLLIVYATAPTCRAVIKVSTASTCDDGGRCYRDQGPPR
jgi:hypothetical protein